MSRSILTALTAGAMLVAFAAVPPMLPGSSTLSLSSPAEAAVKSKTKPTPGAWKGEPGNEGAQGRGNQGTTSARMGGGGGRSGGSGRFVAQYPSQGALKSRRGAGKDQQELYQPQDQGVLLPWTWNPGDRMGGGGGQIK